MTQEERISKIYDFSNMRMMNMAKNLKTNWAKNHLKSYEEIKEAFEKVLDMRYAERLDVYKFYYNK